MLTRPDAVRSRGKKLEPSPVKEAALELGLPVMEANRMTSEVLDALRAAEAEIFCVAAYGKKLEPSPVKEAALELGLPVMEANRMTSEVLDALRAAEAEIFCVAAYGCILPDEVLTMAPLGCVNVHASLLPRWRGAAPIQRSILEGDAETGVSIMRIGHGVDTGARCSPWLRWAA